MSKNKCKEVRTEFLQYQEALSKIPQMMVLAEFDENLTFYYGNEAFNKVFGSEEVSFEEKFEKEFANAFSEEFGSTHLLKIRREINQNQKCSLVVALHTVTGNKHYVKLNIAVTEDLLDSPVLSIAINLIDDDMEHIMKLQRENEVYNIAQQLSNSIAYRITITEQKLELVGNSVADLYLDNNCYYVKDKVIEDNLIYEEDIPVLEKFFENLEAGVEEKLNMRFHSIDGRTDWYLIEYTIIRDEQGVPIYAIGKITNVQQYYELQDKANQDLLTGCLNKGTFEETIKKLLHERREEQHAFIIIDLDHFKAINDNLGHYFGDIVLKEVAGKLRRIFRVGDYIGRIGGDEFVVFMRGAKGREIVEKKAREIVEALDITYKKNSLSYGITASIGIAMIPSHGQHYEEVYQNADTALYHTKGLGKNGYSVYEALYEKSIMANKTPIDMANRAMSAYFDVEIAMDTFNLLFENMENKHALDLLIRHLGEHYQVSRCYVFQRKEGDEDVYVNTHEWCAEGVETQMERLQHVTYNQFEEIFQEANDEGIYYCNDIDMISNESTKALLNIQGVQSFLLSLVKKANKIEYIVGFDDVVTRRMWKPKEISTLTYTSKIIAQHLLYCDAIRKESLSR